MLWARLRGNRLRGFKFRRQHACGPFILDFDCARHKLAVKLDGGQHFDPDAQAYDVRRTRYLASHGISVLRFGNDTVLHELDGVLAAIAIALGVDDPAR